MTVTSEVRQMIFEQRSAAEIRELAMKQGMTTLYYDGIKKVLAGTSSLEEVYRIAKRTEQDALVS
jgi:type IV pilus assembly protein PilB